MNIAILSCALGLAVFESPDANNPEVKKRFAAGNDLSHLNADYQLLKLALKRKGINATFIPWNQPNVDWSTYDAALLHSTWDYYDDQAAFLQTLRQIDAAKVILLNPLSTVIWNSDKHYLQDLSRAALPVIETTFVETEQVNDITPLLSGKNWDKGFIFKPCISAGGVDVFHVRTLQDAQQIYLQYFKDHHPTLMIQPFLEEVCAEGEWSFIFLNGEYSHGALKKASGGDIMVKHSIENQKHQPTEDMIAQATKIFNGVKQLRHDDPLYTRVDTIKHNGKLLIMEIEQIEPFLYLHARPDHAADQLVAGIIARVTAAQ